MDSFTTFLPNPSQRKKLSGSGYAKFFFKLDLCAREEVLIGVRFSFRYAPGAFVSFAKEGTARVHEQNFHLGSSAPKRQESGADLRLFLPRSGLSVSGHRMLALSSHATRRRQTPLSKPGR